MTSLQSAIDALTAHGCKPTPSGAGYTAYCPVHESDHNGHKPSLSIHPGDKQPFVLNCHAGCDFREIEKALGLEKPAPVNGKRRVIATYSYRDAQGQVVSEKVRYDPKDFRQRWPDGSGGWLWKKPTASPAVLYRLPELRAAIAQGETVWVCEGEKDADRLTAGGLAATCNIEGASKGTDKPKWRKEYTAQLAGAARVMLIPDHDEPGRAHMAAIAQALRGKVGDVRTLELPGLSGAKGDNDVSDWLNAGHTAEDLLALAESAGKPIKAERPQAAGKAGAPPWYAALMRKADTEQLLKNHFNAVMIVENAYPGLVGYNEFRQQIEARIASPWRKEPGQWTERDTGELAFHLAKEFTSFTLDALAAAVMTVAYRHPFNPAQDRLRALAEQWDGIPRLDTWLIVYWGAAHNASNERYLQEIGGAWMKGTAARVLFPGCKRDDVLVTRGEQGIGKSTAAQRIAEAILPDSFTDSLGNLDSKDSKAAIRGIIIAELGELSVLNKSDLESIKAFVATRSDHFREAYGRGERDYPRTVSFIGTTNHSTFLKDPTGNRRFWPVTLPGPINIDRFTEALPQLLGEAARRVMNGERWFVSDREALAQAHEVRTAHFVDDVWTEAVLQAADLLLSPGCTLDGANPDYVTVAAILGAMGVRIEQQTVPNQTRVGGVLRVAGWRDKKKRIGDWKTNKTVWAWYPPTVPPESCYPLPVPPVSARQIAAVPPVTPCSPYFEDLVKMGEMESSDSSDSELSTPPFSPFVRNRMEQGEQGEQSGKQRANPVTPYGGTEKQGEQSPVESLPGLDPDAHALASVLRYANGWLEPGELARKSGLGSQERVLLAAQELVLAGLALIEKRMVKPTAALREARP